MHIFRNRSIDIIGAQQSSVLKLEDLLEKLLQVFVLDLVGQGRDERLGFVGIVATQRSYTVMSASQIPIQHDFFASVPSWARSNLARSLCALNKRSTASTFSFWVKRAK
jgi:hypothetical protein